MNEFEFYAAKFLKDYCPNRGLGLGSVTKYRYNMNGFFGFCKAQDPLVQFCSQLTGELFHNYLLHLNDKEDRKPETVKKAFSTLKSFMMFLVEEGVLTASPLQNFRLCWVAPADPPPEKVFLKSEIRAQKNAFLKYCKGHCKLSAHTIRAYSYDLEFFFDFFENHEPPVLEFQQINKALLEEHLKLFSESFAKKTIKRRFACLMSFMIFLKYKEIITENPFDSFHLKVNDPLCPPKFMTLGEVDILLNIVYGRKARSEFERLTFVRDTALLELLFAGGMRVAELCGLTFSDYDSVEQSLLLHGKGSKERMIFITEENAILALASYLKDRNKIVTSSEFIFLNKYNRHLTTQDVRNVVTKCANLAAFEKNITPHSFRHTFASLLLEEGVSIKYIQEFLGHSSIVTTQIYLHTTPETKRMLFETKHPREKLHFLE
ncbi:MAG: tyrosine-type recombinase/integrase [Peptostreptococcaceae bacterium]|nr:tyrosine-type recombinase/integrase [Peptostreptococcaceae bacterium]